MNFESEWAFHNMNGTQTGFGRVRQIDVGFYVEQHFGSPFRGSICDDGPVYQKRFATMEEAESWLESAGFTKTKVIRPEPYVPLTEQQIRERIEEGTIPYSEIKQQMNENKQGG